MTHQNKLKRFNIVMIGIMLFLTNCLFAQLNKNVPKIGNWSMFFGQIRLTEKFGIHAEAQFRDYKLLNQPEQILLRTGIVYYLNPLANITLGYASVSNFLYNDEPFESPTINENRIWQQLLMKNSIGKFFFEHRYRVEQRWLKSQNNNTYRDRIRYLLRMIIPLNKKTIENQTIFLSFYDELFINITSNPFDRNRLFGAVGYQFGNGLNLQLGYMAQTVNISTKHYFQTAVNYTFDLRKKGN
jgi:hypothetical protein